MLSDTRKTWLSTQFFAGGVFNSTGLLKAILSDLNNTSDADSVDITWVYSNLGGIYTPPVTGLESGARITSIIDGSSVYALMDCPVGQICDLTPKAITLQGIATTANDDAQAKAWLMLHLPIGSNVILTPVGDSYIIEKGTDNLNNQLAEYLINLPQVTPTTGATVNARVISITDGDTFEASLVCAPGQLCVTTPFTVRLDGVSASELNFQSGRTAKTWLGDHIPPGTVVKLTIKGIDSYNRQVATVYYPDGVNINSTMILEGQANSYFPEAESFAGKSIGIQVSGCRSSNMPVSMVPTLEFVGPVCDNIYPSPYLSTFKYKVRNNGNANWIGWLGVVLHGKAGDFEFTGEPKYAKTIAPGSEVELWAKVVVPANIGALTHWDAMIESKS